MSSVTIAVDLAKHVFEVAVSTGAGRITERKRLSRSQFERFWANRSPCRVVLEACASSHFWGRRLRSLGFDVVLIPAQYVRPYVRRSKTDRTDCEALLEAERCGGIHPVTIKSEDQQAITALHRMRSQWMATRTARINALRALLGEFGLAPRAGARRFLAELPQLLDETKDVLPARVRRLALAAYEEIRSLEAHIEAVDDELEQVAREVPMLESLRQIPGIGTLTATALYASVGNVHAFPSGRHLASWLGLTPRESSSGSRRRLGRISKQGDVYLRMLLIHGARSALLGAERRRKAGHELTRLQRWALERAEAGHRNCAAVALANKIARIVWAIWKHERSFNGNFQPQARAA
jgi:transposase